MGMYGYVRSIGQAELELAQRRPREFYKQFLGNQEDLNEFAIREGQALQKRYEATGLYRRMKEGFSRGEGLTPEDQELLQKLNQESAALAKVLRARMSAGGSSYRRLGEPEEADLHKSWHCLHFMFTGRSDGGDGPLAMAVLGGKEVPDSGQMAYGPARYLMPEEVVRVLEALDRFPISQAAGDFDAKRAEALKIYCLDPTAEELLLYFGRLKACYQHAAGQANGMLLFIT